MVGFSGPNKIDLAVIASSCALLIFGYVIYSTHLVRVSVWFTIFTIYVCWMGYLGYRWMGDDEAGAAEDEFSESP